MMDWTQKLAQLQVDAALQPQLKIWQKQPHETPLALFRNATIIAANQAALDYFACLRTEILNAALYDFAPRLQLNGQSSIEQARRLFEAAADKPQMQEWLHLNRNGKELPTRLYLYPVKLNDDVLVLARFQHLDRRSQPRQRRTDEFAAIPRGVLSGILEESAEAVAITDEHNLILAANKALCRLSGYSTAQLLGKSLEVLEVTDDIHQQECSAALKERDFWQGEMFKQKADGSQFSAWQSSRRIIADGKPYLVTIFSDISDRKRLESRLTEQAMYDVLTGLPNRRHMKKLLNEALEFNHKHADNGRLGALMFLDLNGFKHVNDCFGHSMGDRILQLVAARLEAGCIEMADIARMGGDEFTLILTECESRKEIRWFADQIVKLFDTPFELEGQKFYLGTSIGISLFDGEQINSSQLLSQADTAMYCAKRSADHIMFYDKSMSDAAEHRLKLLGDLRHAMSLGQFSIYYQPIVQLKDNHLLGAEALLRWQKTPHELLEAADFVPLLEETGLIVSVGNWVLEQACYQAAMWRKHDHPDFTISVNVSPMQLEHLDFISQVKKALKSAGLPADALALEITESALLHYPQQARQTLEKLHNLGLKVTIDDFGTGFSSLSRLGNMPIDGLKIDREFVCQLDNSRGRKLCHAIVQLSQALELSYVVEGIETEQQKAILLNMGEGQAQGFFFGYPLHPQQFALAHFQQHVAR
ncbi:putative bifunctional diguanylate cyclase/phosphodiesterase [Shewanella dokdonensis]|uniref:putative bifunctional diguanylate cyclase/phosphodiesterase n=1 Tax=Shewanella dokdonensis TaxID=712036 RepID=UPI00200D9CCF|nr:EAL domain-containing protein [Shewanella dokdonensis]MCL1075703.1 EAL domain-containing protein [Shewanella dokdonensis]